MTTSERARRMRHAAETAAFALKSHGRTLRMDPDRDDDAATVMNLAARLERATGALDASLLLIVVSELHATDDRVCRQALDMLLQAIFDATRTGAPRAALAAA